MTQYKYTDTKKQEVNREIYLKDKYAIKILRNEDNRDYLIKIICGALGISEETIGRDFELVDIRLGLSSKYVDSEADLVSRNEEGYINIEVNFSYKGKSTENKNMSYICELVLRQIKRGTTPESYKNMKRIYQINLNSYDQFKEGRFIYSSKLIEEHLHKVRSDLLRIVDINLDFLSNIDYNTIKEYEENSLERLLYIFVCNNKKALDEIYMGDMIMEKIKSQLYDLEEDLDSYLFYDREELKKLDAFDAGKEEGHEEERTKIILNMIESGLPMEDISKITKIPLTEIQEIVKKSESED